MRQIYVVLPDRDPGLVVEVPDDATREQIEGIVREAVLKLQEADND